MAEKGESAKNEIQTKPGWRSHLCGIASSNVFQRTTLGLIMLQAFIFLCKSNKVYMMAFTVWLTLGISYELISLMKRNGHRTLPLHPLQVTLLLIIVYFSQLIVPIRSIYPGLYQYRIFQHPRMYLFYSYALVFMFTVFSFRKSRLSSQLLMFAIVHISGTVMGLSCAYGCMNIARGSFYYFYPCILVISNDIFAYIIGKSIGRTPLYSLSPKKTREGFIGASFFTLLVGWLLCYLKLYHGFMADDMDTVLSLPLRKDRPLLNIPMLFFHNLAFSGFASFVAPFAGFLASAIKRTFKKKDFGTVIPGHGGLTDRMDCQLLMVFFTHFYMRSFFKNRTESIGELSVYLRNNFTGEEIMLLINKLVSAYSHACLSSLSIRCCYYCNMSILWPPWGLRCSVLT